MLNIIKNKIIKKALGVFILFAISLFSVNAISADEQVIASNELEQVVKEQLEINSIEELQQDLSNRLILGVFGKDALIMSLGSNVSDNVADEISKLSIDEVQMYSKPFNVGNLSALLMILSSFFFIAFSVLIMYFAWVLFEGLFNTQDSGEFFGRQRNTLFSFLKGTTAVILILPVYGFSHKPFSDYSNAVDGTNYGSFSMVQLAIFKAIGLSNQYTNHIWGSFVNNFQRAYPTIKLPNTYAKENEAKEILDYVTCIKSHNSEMNIAVNFENNKSEKGVITFNSAFGGCKLDGSIKYNQSTINELKKDTMLSTTVESVVDYEDLIDSSIESSVKGMFEKSKLYADILIREYNTNSRSRNSNGLLVNATNYREMCDNPENMVKSGDLHRSSIPILKYYMQKCLSEEFIISYISKSKEKGYDIYASNTLNGFNTDLCDDEFATSNNNRTFVKTEGDKLVNKSSTSKEVSQCLKEACTGDSGLYQCTTAIEFAKTITDSERMIKQGWLTSGAYSYMLFSGFSNNLAQELVSSFSAGFDYDLRRNVTGSRASKNAKFSIYIPASNSLKDDFTSDIGRFLDEDIKENEKIMQQRKESMELVNPSDGFMGFGGKDGLFGVYKFAICSNNPYKVIDGFSCGNITEEMHQLGAKMLTISIEIKMAQTAGKIFTTARKANAGAVNQGMAGASKVMGFFGKNLQRVFDGVIRVVGFNNGSSASSPTTAFSSIDAYWYQNPEVYLAMIALASGEVPFIDTFFNILVGILFILGIIFGFLLPLLPYFLSLTVISGWMVMFLEALLISNVWAATLISPSNNHTSETAKKGLLLLMTIFLRAPFMIIGLVIAWILSNVLIGSLLEISNISDALLLTNSGGVIMSFVDTIVKLVVYLSLVYFIYNLVFSIIEGFYEIGVNWLFGSTLSPFASKNRSEKWRDTYKGAKGFVGGKG